MDISETHYNEIEQLHVLEFPLNEISISKVSNS